MSNEISDQVVLVSGAGGDLGRALAVKLAKLGARLALTDIDAPGLAATVQALHPYAAKIFATEADLRLSEDIERVVRTSWGHFGRIDSLVNMAGGIGHQNTKRLMFGLTEEIWDEVININLRMHFFLTKSVCRRMIDAGIHGRVVNIGSNGTVTAQQGIAHYGAAKAGLIKMTRDMAIELAPHGILVNAVSPGVIDTERMRKIMTQRAEVPGEVEAKLKTVPLHRFGEPRNVAHMVVALLEPDADYCTGVEIFVDGGFTLGVPMWGGQ